MADLRDLYRKHQEAVPESFIWFVVPRIAPLKGRGLTDAALKARR